MDNLLITICARGGSKGIPGKNIRVIGGQPLIKYSYEHALRFKKWIEKEYKLKVDIELSTDSKEILDVCSRFNFETNYLRPEFWQMIKQEN